MLRNRISTRRRPTRRTFAISMAVLLGLAVATPALAGGLLRSGKTETESEKPTWAVPAKRQPVEGEGTDALQARLSNAEMRVKEAMQNAAAADYQYTRARTRRYPRGEALQEIKDRVGKMQSELTEAENDFMGLVEEARREGMPMGTLMPYMDFSDQIRKNQSARAAGK